MGIIIEHIFEDGVEKKKCSRCKSAKALDCFPKNKRTWDQLYNLCKPCVKLVYIGRKEKALARMKEYHQENREKRLAYLRDWQKANPDYAKKKYRSDKEKGGEKFIAFRLKKNIQSRLWAEFKRSGTTKTEFTVRYMGCTVEKLWIHLESQFEDGMTRSNYNKWQCDHFFPVASFDLQNPVHQRACFHYKNIRPMWAQDNLRKSDKYDKDDWELYMKNFIERYIM